MEVRFGLRKKQIPLFSQRYGINIDEEDIFAEEKLEHGGHLFYVTNKGVELPFGLRKYTDRYMPTKKDKFTMDFFEDILRETWRRINP